MKKETLSSKHEKILSDKLANIDTALSEYSFANLYLFRDKHNYSLIDYHDNLFLSGITYDNKTFLMPLCDFSNKENEAYLSDLIALSIDYDMIYPIPENWLYLFPTDSFDISYIEDDSDYLYEIETFVSYPGRKLHAKRNLVSQFLRDNTAEILPINNENSNLAIDILERWQNETAEAKDETDFFSCAEALKNINKMNQIGFMVLINGIPEGFVLGERYAQKYSVIHFAKAGSRIKGIYQYMFSVFAQDNKENQCEFINLEQDLGKEGLRAMKKSYQPIKLLQKYRVTRK